MVHFSFSFLLYILFSYSFSSHVFFLVGYFFCFALCSLYFLFDLLLFRFLIGFAQFLSFLSLLVLFLLFPISSSVGRICLFSLSFLSFLSRSMYLSFSTFFI